MRKHLQLAAIAVCIVLSGSGRSATTPVAEAYRLGVDDKIRIRVYEWRNSVGEVHEWKALVDEFTVGPSGDLSLPLVGPVAAAGKTPEALAGAIADQLQSAVGMAKRPLVSVEIAHYRPFYIVGAVNHPGEYPYRPGMTVLQALGIAGGLFRVTEGGMLQLQRSALTTAGDLRVLNRQHDRLAAHRAGLQAELDGSNDINFPQELKQRQSEPEIAAILKEEQLAFVAHRDALQNGIAARIQLKDLLAKEVVSLQQKIASADQELGMLKGEVTKVAEFVRKGLAVAPREFSLRQNNMEMQRVRLDLDTAVLRAREEIGKTEQSIIELQNQTRKEVLREFNDTGTKLAEVSTKIGSVSEIVRHDEATMPEVVASSSDERNAVIYTIVRREEGGSREVEAAEATAVQPGDTIRVRRQFEIPVAAGPRVDPSANSALPPHQPAMARAKPR